MSHFKIRVVLEGIAKFRDGKKWKKRYCLLAISPKNEYALHLYMGKSYDNFAPYRNENYITDYQRASCQRSKDWSDDSSIFEMCPQVFPTEDDVIPAGKPVQTLVNMASQSCQAAIEATAAGLSVATNLATRLNAPAPIDEISGFESGYHMDKESNIVVLIGGCSIYILALPHTDEMFRWAEAMSQIMMDNRFRVSLRKSTDGAKLPLGLQGCLHVQQWRLCLIGEPSSGCKFICSWRLDWVLKAYTLSLPPNADSYSVNALGRQTGQGDVTSRSHHSSISSNSWVNCSSTSAIKPKCVLILEADQNCGKGRGTHTFELDGGSLHELSASIEAFMNRRYAPLNAANSLSKPPPAVTACPSSTTTTTQPVCSFHAAFCGVPDNATRHTSPQNVPRLSANETCASRSSPLPVPAPFNRSHNGSFVREPTVRGPSCNLFSCPSRHYSNLIPTGLPSLSLFDQMLKTVPRSTSDSTGNMELEAGTGANSVDSRLSINTGHSTGDRESNFPCNHSYGRDSYGFDLGTSYHGNPSRLLMERISDEGFNSLRGPTNTVEENTQVARVAAGLVISKRSCNVPFPTTKRQPVYSQLPVCRSSNVEAPVDVNPIPRPPRPCRRCRGRRNSSSDVKWNQGSSNLSSGSGGVQHGVFCADEDISDSERNDIRRTSDSDTRGKPINPTCSLDSGYIDWRERSNYRIYRRRHCQYRACFCPVYIERSLSTNLLFHLRTRSKSSQEDRVSMEPEESRVYPVRTPLLAIAFDSYSSPVTSAKLKTFHGAKWKQLHRLLHRKHSKSQDSLSNACLPASTYVSSSMGGCPGAKSDFNNKSKSTQNHNSMHNAFVAPRSQWTRPQILVQCSRHGFQSYDLWFHLLQHPMLDVSLCARCHHKAQIIGLPVTPVKQNSPPCARYFDPGTSGASFITTLRNLLHSRPRSRSKYAARNVCAKRRISTPALKDSNRPSTATGARPSVISWAGHHPSSESSVGAPGFKRIPRSSINRNLSSLVYARRHLSALSLASLPSSEPTIPTMDDWFNRRFPLLNCSFYSSVSSLPTSHSVSDCSSLVSTSMGHRKVEAKFRTRHSAFDFTEGNARKCSGRTRSSSFCETDEISSGSGWCDEYPRVRRASQELTKNVYVKCPVGKAFTLASHNRESVAREQFEHRSGTAPSLPSKFFMIKDRQHSVGRGTLSSSLAASCGDCLMRLQPHRSHTLPLCTRAISPDKVAGSKIASTIGGIKPIAKSPLSRLSPRSSACPENADTNEPCSDPVTDRSESFKTLAVTETYNRASHQSFYCNIESLKHAVGHLESTLHPLLTGNEPVDGRSFYVNVPVVPTHPTYAGLHTIPATSKHVDPTTDPKRHQSSLSPVQCSCGVRGHPCRRSVASISPGICELPAEVRDPSRNYAMVDLRPSPASSVNVKTELSRSVVQHLAGSSTMIGVSTSTSTGSDCASDAATLTSDTLGSCNTTCTSAESKHLVPSAEVSRRCHSHSFSSSISEAPPLNYVYVVASRHPEGGSSMSDSIGFVPAEHTTSASSSSGLGGIASQSVTPPVGSAPFCDLYNNRSLTSSATSSGEGGAPDHGFHSTSPLNDESVAYTQIDFTRTMALGEVRGDMEHVQASSQASSRDDHRCGKKSVRKTFAYPIRSIKQSSNQKKSQ